MWKETLNRGIQLERAGYQEGLKANDRSVVVIGQSVRPGPCPANKNQRREGTAFYRPVRSLLELAPHIRVKDRSLPFPTVPHRPPPSSTVPRCCFPLFSLFSTVFHRPLPSPIVPTRICFRLWGLLPFITTAVLEIQGRGWRHLGIRPFISSSCPTSKNVKLGLTTFCRPVSSRALGSPPPGPTGPRQLRTL